MIGRLRGKIQEITAHSVILDVNGVGYLVFVNLSTLSKIGHAGEEASLVTYLEVKEDKLALFGFLNSEEHHLFQLLIGVSGVGCKSALTILDLGTSEQIQQAIREEKVSVLTQVSGIGKKTAERLILELKDKVGISTPMDGVSPIQRSQHEDLVDALESLGFKPGQIQRVITDMDPKMDLGEQVRQALKLLQG